MSPKLLLITYAFPPLQAAEAYLSAKALSELKGFDVDILTIDPSRLGLPLDQSMQSFVEERFGRIHRVAPPAWLNKQIFHLLRGIMVFPDRFRIFNSYIVKAALKLGIQNYDIVMSWSQWHSIHLAGASLKHKFPEIPWVAHMSDPWSDNPFLPKIPGYSITQRWLERRVIRCADSVNFTTIETQDLVMQKYPHDWAKKTDVIPHSYAPALYPNTGSSMGRNNRWILRYLGNFYGPRNPQNLARALAILQKRAPDLVRGVRIEIVGRWIGNTIWRPEDEGVQGDLLVLEKPVSYCKSLSLMREADMLLIIDAPFEKSVFFPSKLVDYIGANRPILAFTPDGACADVLRKVGGMIVSPATITSIQNGLEMAIRRMKTRTAIKPRPEIALQYDAKHVAKLYSELLDRLIKTN